MGRRAAIVLAAGRPRDLPREASAAYFPSSGSIGRHAPGAPLPWPTMIFGSALMTLVAIAVIKLFVIGLALAVWRQWGPWPGAASD